MSNSNMNVNANKTVVKRFIKDVLEKNRPILLDELCLEDFVMYFRGEPMVTGLVKMKEFVAWHNSTFPDVTVQGMPLAGN